MFKALKKFAWGYLLLGLVIISVGLCFIIFNNALNYLAIAVGAICTVTGIVFGAVTLARFERNFNFAIKTIFALVCILCGTVTMLLNDLSVGIIIDVIILLLIVDGSFKVYNAITSKRFSVFGWWIMLTLALIQIITVYIFSMMMGEASRLVTIVIGLEVLFDGVLNVLTTFFFGATNKKMLKVCAEQFAEMEREKEERLQQRRAAREARMEKRAKKAQAKLEKKALAEKANTPEPAPEAAEIIAPICPPAEAVEIDSATPAEEPAEVALPISSEESAEACEPVLLAEPEAVLAPIVAEQAELAPSEWTTDADQATEKVEEETE